MSEQEQTRISTAELESLRQEYQYRIAEIAQRYLELLERGDEDNEELKAAGMILACGVSIGEDIEKVGEDVDLVHLDALSEFLTCATSMLVYAGKKVKMSPLPSPEISDCLKLSETVETLENTP